MYTFCMNLNLFVMVLVHPRTQTQPPTEQRKKSRKTEGHEKHISCRVCEGGGVWLLYVQSHWVCTWNRHTMELAPESSVR